MNISQGLVPDRFIIFCRYPVPGRTKTRLISALGPTGAADLHRRLTEKTLKTIRTLASLYKIGLEIRFEGGSWSKMQRWLGSELILVQQGPGDLGERMRAAFFDAFQSGCHRVILTGTDIPEMKPEHLSKALDALTTKDLVLGPSSDGGYWLMGQKRPLDIFHGIRWGTGKVLAQTLSLAKKQGLSVHLTETLSDLDTEEDLNRCRAEEKRPGPYLSIIIPVLNEAANIEAAIRSASDDDAEITVVDGGSTDDTVMKATHAEVKVEMSPPGRAIQQNRGAAIARGSVYLFLHADTLLPSGFVRHIFETLMDPQTVAGAFRFKSDLNHPAMKIIEFLTNFRAQYLKLPYGDQCLFIRKEVFECAGGFPEVPIAEDLLLVRHVSKFGRVRIAPAHAVTSARRWDSLGLFRTTLINQVVLAGSFLRISPHTLASLYRIHVKK
jgi:rSAM/selenodomain-associated transferase 2/rSAM/selenodomain-associated transferase 1